jgi:hypothetical protein
MPVDPDPNYVVNVVLAPDQVCKHCGNPLNRHTNSDLGALICMDRPVDSNMPNWEQHGLVDAEGRPYRSLLSQLDQLTASLDQNGLVATYDQGLDLIRSLVARMSQLPLEAVRPPEEWFVPAAE